jgi:hypothetical protein
LIIATSGQAVVTRLIAGTNISLVSSGADSGTGDVTISSTASGTGNVVGPGSSVTSNLASFGDTTGKLIADSGVAISNVVLKNASNTFAAGTTQSMEVLTFFSRATNPTITGPTMYLWDGSSLSKENPNYDPRLASGNIFNMVIGAGGMDWRALSGGSDMQLYSGILTLPRGGVTCVGSSVVWFSGSTNTSGSMVGLRLINLSSAVNTNIQINLQNDATKVAKLQLASSAFGNGDSATALIAPADLSLVAASTGTLTLGTGSSASLQITASNATFQNLKTTIASNGLAFTGTVANISGMSIFPSSNTLIFSCGTSGFVWNNQANSATIMALTNAGAFQVNGGITCAGPMTVTGTFSGAGIQQVQGGYIYPGRNDAGGNYQTTWYLTSNSTWGLETNTNIHAVGGFYSGTGIYQNAGYYIYPGSISGYGAWQSSAYLASHQTYGLYSNTGCYFDSAAPLYSPTHYLTGAQGATAYSWQIDGDTYIKNDTANRLMFVCGGSIIMYMGSGAYIHPGGDNTHWCGHPSLRWSVVYAATGTINTSNRREKKDIEETIYGSWFLRLLKPVDYRWIKDSARGHGLIAQDVQAVAPDFGGLSLNDEGEAVGLNYASFTAALVKGWQELDQRLRRLENGQ